MNLLIDQAYLFAVADRILEMDGAVAHDWLIGVAKQLKQAAPPSACRICGGWVCFDGAEGDRIGGGERVNLRQK